MSYARLIDTQYVYLHSTIDNNTDGDLIDPNIDIAQNTNIQQIIGYNLLNKLMDLVSTQDIDDPANIKYKTLLANFVQPALCHWTVWATLPSIQYRLTNKSIIQKTNDSSVNTGIKDLMYLRDNVRNYAEFYSQRVREYIINDPSSFPEYFQSIGIERIRPKRSVYFSGWSGTPTNNLGRGPLGHGYPDCKGCDNTDYPLNW